MGATGQPARPERARGGYRRRLGDGQTGVLMARGEDDRRVALPLRFAAAVLVTGGASVVLWVRQTPGSLLRTESLAGAFVEVAFWALPTLVLFVVLLQDRRAVAVGGVLLAVGLGWGWWSFAVDEHSTASIGPAGLGWLLGPVVVAGIWGLRRGRRPAP